MRSESGGGRSGHSERSMTQQGEGQQLLEGLGVTAVDATAVEKIILANARL